jgi:TRAP-type C4-dicarboxylate transport system permease small subunit
MGKILAVSVLLFSALTLAASAQIPSDYGIKETAKAAGLPTGQTSVSAVTAGIINTLLGIVGALAVVLIIYAGFLWMTSQGNEEKISTAKKLIAGSVIGLFIIFAAYTIALFVVKQVAKSTGGAPTTQTTEPNTQTGAGSQCIVGGGLCIGSGSCIGGTIISADCDSGLVCCIP